MRSLLFLALTVAVVAPVDAEPVDLSYAPVPGVCWDTEAKTAADIPTVGHREVVLRYEIRCDGSQGGEGDMAFHVPRTPVGTQGQVVGPLDGTLCLAADGTISRLASPQLQDPAQASHVRNVAVAFPHLPGGPVELGASWTWQSLLWLPKGSKDEVVRAPSGQTSRLPDQVRVDGTYTFARRRPDGGAVIRADLREAPGEPMKVRLSGELTVAVPGGRLLSGSLKGELKVKQFLFWVTVPVTLTTRALP